MISIVEQVFRFGQDHPEKSALINGKVSRSYREMLGGIVFARDVLSEKYGIKSGDKIILAADKQLEFVSVYFACHLIGAAALPIAPDTNEKRYEFIRAATEPGLVIGIGEAGDGSAHASLSDFAGIAEEYDAESLGFPAPETTADILFTTGTTGEPKGVRLSHRNIAAAARNINTFIENRTEDVEMLALPISHSFGLGRMRCALSNGQSLVMLGSFANVKRFFRFIGESRVNGFGMVPASWAMLKKLSGERIGEFRDVLRYIEIGSAPMPLADKHLLMELLPDTRICMHYGLTEASRSAFIEFHSESSHLDTVGRQSPNMTISIKDEEGRDVPAGEEGEICVMGDAVTDGYIGLDNSGAFHGEFFRTGDWGSKDAYGYITLRSRKKELINVGGKKVSPAEVEEVLDAFDFVKDCACIGAPDPEGILGEVVKAFIVTDDPEKVSFDAVDPLIGGSLEGFKHPAIYEVISEIPKTSSGKVQRLMLKDR